MSNKHAPGPWKETPSFRDLYIVDAAGRSVALVCTVDDTQEAEGVTREATARVMAAGTEFLAAAEAAEQCITDLLDLYSRDASHVALDEAVKSLRDDALRLTQIALTKADGESRRRKAWRSK